MVDMVVIQSYQRFSWLVKVTNSCPLLQGVGSNSWVTWVESSQGLSFGSWDGWLATVANRCQPLVPTPKPLAITTSQPSQPLSGRSPL
jgi:hypothetical protein